jgi:hypothetical protein
MVLTPAQSRTFAKNLEEGVPLSSKTRIVAILAHNTSFFQTFGTGATGHSNWNGSAIVGAGFSRHEVGDLIVFAMPFIEGVSLSHSAKDQARGPAYACGCVFALLPHLLPIL